MPFKIAIIGAGPAGCLLARLLANKSSPSSVSDITIFEAESAPDFRSQGGTLDLHEKTGQRALREAGLWDEFAKHARYDGEAMKLADKKLLCYVSMGAGKKGNIGGRPEIDRPVLRRMLFDSLGKEVVRWGYKVRGVEEVEGRMTVHSVNQPSEGGFDLIVGADGTWSKTRTFVTDVKPFYSGIAGHAFNIPDAKTTQPELYDLTNHGSLFAWSDGKTIMAQQQGDGAINVYVFGLRSEDWRKTCGYDVGDLEATKAACRKEYADWDPRLQAFIEAAKGDAVPRELFMLPIGHSWPHKRGVTIVGDAAHTMTPFAGEGVNLAMEDCLELASAILKSATSEELDTSVQDFEKDMFVRMEKTAQLTYDMMSAMMFVENSPRNGIEQYILRAASDEVGWLGRMVLTPLVYAYFFVFKLIW
ncbi:hypothetical protein B0A48_04278 [Cryoendolithus antarcticus]|uniref:FAD-binding domain-containing protein n=1 Tax=Cryoendolithus antarcticus TaxID=1507870 RepID=A0A1V8TEW5_9PEZI|nr:hypothetical protein B0A48_04278 [Cryoendolithus antarcticus]